MRPLSGKLSPKLAGGFTVAATTLAAGGCGGVQSVHAPAGFNAGAIGLLGWIMYAGGAVIFLMVMVLLVIALTASPERKRFLTGSGAVIAGGLILPVVVLTALLVYGLAIAARLAEAAPADALRVEVVGEQFWWRVIYAGEDGAEGFETANEIRIPTGRAVALSVKSGDVIHSFWVPSLAGKIDMIPGRVNDLVLSADRPGLYRGQCAEYCGAQHAHMALDVVAQEPAEFDAWLDGASAPAAEPGSETIAFGRQVFLSAGCGSCHTIRGTPANGTIGPDLTHVGSRTTLAAGMLPNNRGAMAGWIVRAQEIKPGNKMPSFDIFSGPELDALTSYLESLT